MEKRYVTFLLIVFLATYFYIVSIKPPAKSGDKGKTVTLTSNESANDDAVSTKTVASSDDEPKPAKKDVESAEEQEFQKDRVEKLIEVSNNLNRITFTDRGGRPSSWENVELKYYEELADKKKYPVELIPQDNKFYDRDLPLEIRFREYNSRNFTEFNYVFYDSTKEIKDNGDVVLTFTSPEIEGYQLIKKYTIPQNKYWIDLDVTLKNLSESDTKLDDDKKGLSISWGPGIGRFVENDKYDRAFMGAFYKTSDKIEAAVPKVDKSIEDSRAAEFGGLETKYYFCAIFPRIKEGEKNRAFAASKTLVYKKNILNKHEAAKHPNFPMTIELFEDATKISANDSVEYGYRIYVAPKNYNALIKEKYPVSNILFHNSFNWMRWLSLILLKTLNWLQSVFHNYGVAIILLTIIVKVVTHPLTHKGMKLQAKAMAEQEKIRPYIEEIQKKYKDNPQKKNAEMMKLYKEHGINPFGMLRGCIPMMIQLPIFFAFYKILNQSIDLKNQPFLWITDLSRPDALFHFGTAIPLLGTSFNLLPILMGASQFFVSKVTTTNIKDPAQRQMMVMMPVIFTFIMYSFPSGLILYWFVQNLWQFAHQTIMNKLIRKDKGGHQGSQSPASAS